MLRYFSDVYQKSVSTMKAAHFKDEGWQTVLGGLRILLADNGPSIKKCASLDELRAKLNQIRNTNNSGAGATASAILDLCNSDVPGWQDRVALIKFLMHFYLIGRRGGQAVWIADSPESFFYWPYDMFQFKGERDVASMIEDRKEFLGGNTRELMSDSFQQARKWTADVQFKLASPSAATLQKVKRWFHFDEASPEAVASSAQVLHNGFKKIHGLCNQNTVVFSNFPPHRINPDYDHDIAMVSYNDSMTVLYFYKKFKEYGERDSSRKFSRSFQAVLTIIHEFSHLAVKTDDHRYSFRGIKPGRKLTEEKALMNADSWAYFAADLAGMLGDCDFNQIYRETIKHSF